MERYSSAAGDVWRGAMEALLATLSPGYLRCCLAFLNGNAKSVLSDNAVQLSHRLAFAAHYLPDDDLVLLPETVLLFYFFERSAGEVSCAGQ
jgi:hypothetical protein